MIYVLFFSSRRRHTRFDCDWSSDVCSSDLIYGREMFETWYKMASLLQSGLKLAPVITHHFQAQEYLKGFETMGSGESGDRKSTRLNSSHSQISYAVFCLKKKTDDATPDHWY